MISLVCTFFQVSIFQNLVVIWEISISLLNIIEILLHGDCLISLLQILIVLVIVETREFILHFLLILQLFFLHLCNFALQIVDLVIFLSNISILLFFLWFEQFKFGHQLVSPLFLLAKFFIQKADSNSEFITFGLELTLIVPFGIDLTGELDHHFILLLTNLVSLNAQFFILRVKNSTLLFIFIKIFANSPQHFLVLVIL